MRSANLDGHAQRISLEVRDAKNFASDGHPDGDLSLDRSRRRGAKWDKAEWSAETSQERRREDRRKPVIGDL